MSYAWETQLRANLKGAQGSLSARSPAQGARGASVMVALSRRDDPDVVYIEKGSWLRHHAGQLAFPGGSAEPEDVDAVATALREAEEETGLVGVDVLGYLDAAFLSASAFDVTTVVGTWDGLAELRPKDPDEVVAVHRFAVDDLADPNNRVSFVLGKRTGPAFTMGDLFIWGFSALITDGLLRLGGWHREWDSSRLVEVPERFAARRGVSGRR